MRADLDWIGSNEMRGARLLLDWQIELHGQTPVHGRSGAQNGKSSGTRNSATARVINSSGNPSLKKSVNL